MVDSHLHGDHAMGNEAYPETFGANVEVISSVKTREWLETLGLPRLRASLESLPRQIADFRAKLEASKDESERAALRTHIEGLEAYLKEMTPPRVTLPTMTFDRRLVLHRGGREVHLLFLGRAHTAGDVVAYIPSERVIATGDLMHGLLPYMGDGFPDEWPATLRALEALEFDRVIPGHGSVQEGKSVLAEFRGYIEEVTERVTRGSSAASRWTSSRRPSPPHPSARSRPTAHVAGSSASWAPLPAEEAGRDAWRQRRGQRQGGLHLSHGTERQEGRTAAVTRAGPSGRRRGGTSLGSPSPGRVPSDGGGESSAARMAPDASSVTVSQMCWGVAKGTFSTASTCQTSWGWAAQGTTAAVARRRRGRWTPARTKARLEAPDRGDGGAAGVLAELQSDQSGAPGGMLSLELAGDAGAAPARPAGPDGRGRDSGG